MWRHIVVAACLAGASGLLVDDRTAAAVSLWPLQLEMRVPFEPTEFASGGRSNLAYELYVTNYTGAALSLSRIEVLDSTDAGKRSVASFDGERLDQLIQPSVIQATPDPTVSRHQLCAGCTAIVYMWIVIEGGGHAPSRLQHRLFTTDAVVEGAVIGTHRVELKRLSSPVRGMNWQADDGPSNDEDNHHRRGVFVTAGRATDSRRFAIDWIKIENGAAFSGEAKDRRSYHAYGQPVFAVADGTVVRAKDGLPENIPGHNEGFKPAVPITPDTMSGNMIVLDLGGHQFAHYFHLQPSSLRVKTGDHVKRGQPLAAIGTSGDAREPHLHFQLTDSDDALASEGLPYVIDNYRIKSGNTWQQRMLELPLRNQIADFGPE